MTAWTVVSLDSVEAQPWKNGGGTTRELLTWPTQDDWAARVSVADVVSAGPFSSFPGIERWFAVLDGGGVVLDVAGGRHWLRSDSEPFRFDGGLPVHCDLAISATRDFNVMAQPGRSRVRRLQDKDQLFKMRGPGLLAVYAHSLPARLVVDWVIREVPPYHFAWCERPDAASGIARGEDALLVEVRR